MKKILLIMASLLLMGWSVAVLPAQAQRPMMLRQNSSTVYQPIRSLAYKPHDIYGKEIDLKKILDEGKVIILDFSTVWCGPCWNLHQSGALHRAYEKYGPQGTKQIEVLWVDPEGRGRDAIEGKPHTGKDWTNGGTVLYTIISDKMLSKALGINYRFYPSLFLIDNSGYAFEFKTDSSEGRREIPVEALLKKAFSSQDPAWGIIKQQSVYEQESTLLSVEVHTNAKSPVTAYKWSVEGSEQTGTEPFFPLKSEQPGKYKVKCELTNKNGSATIESMVDIQPLTTETTFPQEYNMESLKTIDTRWRTCEYDGDNMGWQSCLARLHRAMLTDELPEVGCNTKGNCASSWGFKPIIWKNEQFEKEPLEPQDNWLISPAIDLPEDATAAQMVFYAKGFLGDTPHEKIDVLLSTSDIRKEDFTVKLQEDIEMQADWKKYSVDLLPYKGKKIKIAFVHKTANGNVVLLDDIAISVDKTITGLFTPTEGEFALAPSVAGAYTTVTAPVGSRIVVFDMAGRIVMHTVARQAKVRLETADIPDGHYLVRVEDRQGNSRVLRLEIMH